MDTQQQAMFVTFFIMIHGLMTDLEFLTINTIPIAHMATAAHAQLEGRGVASHAS